MAFLECYCLPCGRVCLIADYGHFFVAWIVSLVLTAHTRDSVLALYMLGDVLDSATPCLPSRILTLCCVCMEMVLLYCLPLPCAFDPALSDPSLE